jgi:hypothetical protein
MKAEQLHARMVRLQTINECLRAQLRLRQAHRSAHSIGKPGNFAPDSHQTARLAEPFQSNVFR